MTTRTAKGRAGAGGVPRDGVDTPRQSTPTRSSLPTTRPGVLSVTEAVKLGHREGLVALRDTLAAAADKADPNMIPQIAGRLQAVLDRLAELDAREPPKESRVDELLARRRSQTSSSTASGRRRNVRRA